MAKSGSATNDGSYVALAKCFYCLEAGDLLLDMRLGDISRFHDKVINMNPCSKCKGFMEQGIIIIGTPYDQKNDIDAQQMEYETTKANYLRQHSFRRERDYLPFVPDVYRDGTFVVMRDDAFKRVFESIGTDQPLVDKILRCRWTFMEDILMELTGIYDSMDKPDDVQWRKKCKAKGVDPWEEAQRVFKERNSGKKETKADAQPAATAGEDHPGGLPGGDAEAPSE